MPSNNNVERMVHVSLNADHKFFCEGGGSGTASRREDQERIFERFYRVDKSHSSGDRRHRPGPCHHEKCYPMHRGAIKVYSKPDEGTTFHRAAAGVYPLKQAHPGFEGRHDGKMCYSWF